jgi:hypothetical protein
VEKFGLAGSPSFRTGFAKGFVAAIGARVALVEGDRPREILDMECAVRECGLHGSLPWHSYDGRKRIRLERKKEIRGEGCGARTTAMRRY